MEYKFTEVFDVPALIRICESFTRINGTVTALLDLDGNVHVATGWQDICTKFHRVHPETSCRCKESDTALASQLSKGMKYNVYRCKNGLVDVAVPIFIDGEHVGNFFTGQFFFAPPDVEAFEKQADQFGFDKQAYLSALQNVPVYSEDEVKLTMDFLVELTQLIGEMGLKKLQALRADKQSRQKLEELVLERTADLQRSEQLLEATGKTAKVGGWEVDLKTNDVRWTKQLYEIHEVPEGHQPEKLEQALEFFPEGDREYVVSSLTHAIETGEPYDIEVRFITAKGQHLWTRAICLPEMEDGKVVKLRGTFQDVTDQKQLKDDLEQALQTTERANQAKSEFLATMSHEFRTPLNAILGFSEMLRSQYFGPLGADKYEGYANDIHESGEHLLELVNDMLDIAAIEAGKRQIAFEDFDLGSVVKDCVRNVMPAAEEGGVDLTYDIPQKAISLYADRRSVIQIAFNILSNAIKFTEQGGTVNVSIKEADGAVLFTVSDNGIGIPPDKLAAVTDPFMQAQDDPLLARKGTGLGLTIVKSLVDAHAGELTIESELDEGTTVTVMFPCENAKLSDG